MIKLLDTTGGKIVLRRADGSVMLDTSERTPAEIQRIQVTGLTVDWPQVSGEQNVYLPIQNRWRHEIPAHNIITTQVLGALSPTGIAPQFYLTSIKLTQTLVGRAGGFSLGCRQAPGVWFPLVGSLNIEQHYVYLYRAINIGVSGGNLVLEKRQLSIGYDDDFDIQCSTQSTYTMDFDIAWGIFDG